MSFELSLWLVIVGSALIPGLAYKVVEHIGGRQVVLKSAQAALAAVRGAMKKKWRAQSIFTRLERVKSLEPVNKGLEAMGAKCRQELVNAQAAVLRTGEDYQSAAKRCEKAKGQLQHWEGLVKHWEALTEAHK